jgi:CRISPR-associated protein Cas2
VTVLRVERVSPALRGDLSRWMLELTAGVFVGRLPARVRDRVWKRVCAEVADGSAVLVEAADNEQGYRFRLWGTPSRSPEDFGGLMLVRERE